ncbi:SMI1/KNR4 family protein [Sporosarcina saromensis]|uniref:SMI1/KNR4 family protein n=1 Tax=Sporosarcina saromensis TaxID=359365 RepID=A0ABU4GA91_9BACL|nr:SMI1/KNR4 family protein [Sporosarcina saromensis]MDW0113228.1 SMI1/KNR4 family protein [Sporosarcina saromensis]
MIHLFTHEDKRMPATEQDILQVEEKLNLKLPEDFKQLLRIENGGVVQAEKRGFPVDFPIESGDPYIDVEEIMGANEEGLLMSDYFIQEWGLPEQLVLFAGSGHAWVGFNYENPETPNVVYVEPDDGNGHNFHVIAHTFTEFVEKLTSIQ